MTLNADAKKTVLLGACYGALLWVLSVPLFGGAQPWDGRVHVFLILLLLGGGVLGFYGRISAGLIFLGIYAGEALALTAEALAGRASYYLFSLCLLFAFSLPAFVGAYAGGKIAAFRAARHEAAE